MPFAKYLSVVPFVCMACSAALELYDKITYSPRSRERALEKLGKDSEAAHQKALDDMENYRKKYEASMMKSEQECNERIRAQKEEINKAIKELQEQIRKQDETHDEEVRKLEEYNTVRMKELRNESKETLEKAEMEYKIKLDKIEKVHMTEKNAARETLEKAKKEGEEKVAVIEKEKETIGQERIKEMELYQSEMNRINEIYQKQLKEIRVRRNDLRLQNARMRTEQLQLEHKEINESIEHHIQKLLDQITVQTMKDVLRQFQLVLEPVYSVKGSLDNIKTHCVLPNGETAEIYRGELDPDFRSIREEIKNFENRVRRFRAFLINTQRTDPKLFENCSNCISEMDKLMSHHDIISIYTHLSKAIDNENYDTIKMYGSTLNELCNKFTETKVTLDNKALELISKYTPGISEMQQAAINQ